MKLRTLLLLTIFSMSSFLGLAQNESQYTGIRTVVLDAGHGGRDPGNLGTRRYNTVERDITLAVTLKLGEYLREYLPEVNVVYTRTSNKSVTLERRAELANEAQGDLFISIHCDSYTQSSVHGCTSIVLGKNHGDENRIALKENAAILLEDNYEQRYEGFDPNNPMSFIGLNLMQQTYLNESVHFADLVQKQFSIRVKRKDRGVKQQPLYVTSRTAMPAVLIELGFLTNPEEEDFLRSERGQSYMASAIFRAIRDFKAEKDLLVADAISKQHREDDKSPDATKPNPQNDIKEPSLELEKTSPETGKPAEPKTMKENNPDLVLETKAEEGIYFAVQILTLSSQKKPNDPIFKGRKDVGVVEESGLYKYYTGKSKSLNSAKATAREMQKLGFKGAFVIGLENGRRISAVDARKKLP
ncbi:MAG: N-acetylmuramoyl-L-alanine amidase [Bacteroidetes bacterium]|nr:N-acetylmuramoyl-L-alanine amidase [Bacteroidota bacterium]